MILDTEKLVDGPTLLEQIFDERCRPSLRWLARQRAAHKVPYYKLGARVFFDPQQVRAAWRKRGIIRAA